MLKRSRDEFELSDEEEPSFGKQILPVANLPDNFSREPANGMEYLFTVRRAAKQLPHVTRVANPYEIDDVFPSGTDASEISESSFLPSEDWRTSFRSHFTRFRKNACQSTIHVKLSHASSTKPMPDKKERDLWWAFLSGRPESDWNPPKKPKQDKMSRNKHKFVGGMRAFSEDVDDEKPSSPMRQETYRINEEGEVELALSVIDPTELLPTPSSTPAPPDPSHETPALALSSSIAQLAEEKSRTYQAREPTPRLIRQIDHRMSLHLLMYFTYWINQYLSKPEDQTLYPTESHSRWIFALLTRVEDHVSADDMSLLRNLARACIAFLKKMLTERTTLGKSDIDSVSAEGAGGPGQTVPTRESPWWIIIAAVIEVWGQRDLWIDAAAALATTGAP